MPRHSEERKAAVIEKMMPPRNTSIPKLAEETGISDATLYSWRKQARLEGFAVPADGKNSEQWSSAAKFAVVLETASMDEAQLGEYCREKGRYLFSESSFYRVPRAANQQHHRGRSTAPQRRTPSTHCATGPN